MLKRKGLMFTLTGALALSAVLAGVEYAAGQETDCKKITAQIQEAEKEYKPLKDKQKKAFDNWSKYYKQLHSDTYAGTEKPLADSAKDCDSGEGVDEEFCKGVMEEYNQISAKEQETKKEFDAAREEAAKASNKIFELKRQAKMNKCE